MIKCSELRSQNQRASPAGQYAQELLTNLKIFDSLKSKFVYGNNVRQVLSYVETGNVEAGIVYITDAKSNAIRVGATAASNLHSAIVYPVAVLKIAEMSLLLGSLCNFCLALRHKGYLRNTDLGYRADI